jgi:hypothetical protein
MVNFSGPFDAWSTFFNFSRVKKIWRNVLVNQIFRQNFAGRKIAQSEKVWSKNISVENNFDRKYSAPKRFSEEQQKIEEKFCRLAKQFGNKKKVEKKIGR